MDQTFDLDDFFPDYQQLPSFTEPDKIQSWYHSIMSKYEFSSLNVKDKSESKFFNHQEFVSRLLSWITPYSKLFIFHDMGTGKTSTALHTAEEIISNPLSGIEKVVVITRGESGEEVFKQELRLPQFEGKYEPLEYSTKSIKEKQYESNAKINKFYQFYTFYGIGKMVEKYNQMINGDQILKRIFSNKFIIIDEVQNITDTNSEDKDGKKLTIEGSGSRY